MFVEKAFCSPAADKRAKIARAAAVLALAGASLIGAPSAFALADGEADPNFIVDTNGAGYANVIARDDQGRILIGGNFTSLNGSGPVIARVLANGALDTSFHPPLLDGGDVEAILVLNGKILVGGSFATVDGAPRHSLIRLNADGTLDPAFSGPDVNDQNVGPNGTVGSIVAMLGSNGAPDSAGRVYVAGSFSHFSAEERPSLARVKSDGTLDETFTQFDPNAVSFGVASLLVQPTDGRIITGWLYSSGGDDDGFQLVRLNIDGSKDASFKTKLDISSVDNIELNTIAWRPHGAAGQIVIGGRFDSVAGSNGVAKPHNCIARLDAATGNVDDSFVANLQNNGASCRVAKVVQKSDGSLFVAGDFASINNVPWTALARLSKVGALDTAFASAQASAGSDAVDTSAMLQLPDGSLLVSGIFTHIGGGDHTNNARLFDDKIFADGFD